MHTARSLAALPVADNWCWALCRHLGRVYCQHGGIECWANGYMNCAIDKFSTVQAASYLRCLVKRWSRPDEITQNTTIDAGAAVGGICNWWVY